MQSVRSTRVNSIPLLVHIMHRCAYIPYYIGLRAPYSRTPYHNNNCTLQAYKAFVDGVLRTHSRE